MAGNDDSTYGFNRDDAAAVLNMVGNVEVETPGRRVIAGRGSGGGVVIVKTGSGGIAARSSDTPGSGSVTIYTYDGTDLVSTSDTVTAINISTTAHPADCYTTAKLTTGNVYVLDDPAVTDLRLSGLNLQLRRNCDWSTWLTGEECDS
jgi:hypothetical protein